MTGGAGGHEPMDDERITPDRAFEVLQEEQLAHWSWFESGFPNADEAGIRRDGDGWLVYNTDERANPIYQQHHDDESAALHDFLLRTRANTRVHRRRAERHRQQVEDLLRGAAPESSEG
jgi:hypothetical protein